MRLNRFLAAGGGAAALALGVIAPAMAGATSTQSAPTIHERFTLLACPSKPRTTLQLEGCAEHKTVALDKTIDGLNAQIYGKLSKPGRASLITTNTDWVLYRNAACTTEASIYSGGSIQPVAYANCLVNFDSSHITELRVVLVVLSTAG
jgi:uncharacterized protein YecT (DUF1311 family)